MQPSRLSKWLALPLIAALLCSCSTVPEKKPEITKKIRYEAVSDRVYSDISDSEWAAALASFRRSCATQAKKALWKDVCLKSNNTVATDAAAFFTENFSPWKVYVDDVEIESRDVVATSDIGLMTGYYEPLLYVYDKKVGKFTTPILATPDDLIIVDLATLYPKLKGMRLRGKVEGRKLVPYDERSEIVKRKDLHKYAIAWSNDPVEVFFLQIQGSGRLLTQTGEMIRVGYDDQNGHAYKAIGGWLVRKGYMKKEEVSMQNIKRWAEKNPKRLNQLLNQNPSFVFFKTRIAAEPDEGPIGAQGVPLTPQASVAVDRRYMKLGTPLIVQASQENPSLEFKRPVIAQDTGGAIRGPLRFDFFWGFGDIAGANAGKQKSSVKAWVLLPNGASPADLEK